MTKPEKQLDWLVIGKWITHRLSRRWGYRIEDNELLGIALLGAAKADQMYTPRHAGSSRLAWIYTKGYYLAIDDLRANHGVGRIGQSKGWPKVFQGSAFRRDNGESIPFAAHECVGVPQEQFVRTSCKEWLRGLSEKEQRILILRFDEGLTYTEIGQRMSLTEQGANLIALKAIKKLRRSRAGEYEAGERSIQTYR